MIFCSNLRFKDITKFSHTEILSQNMEYERIYLNDVTGLSFMNKQSIYLERLRSAIITQEFCSLIDPNIDEIL